MSLKTSILRRWLPATAVLAIAIGAVAFAVAVGSGSRTAAPDKAAAPVDSTVAAVDVGWVAPAGTNLGQGRGDAHDGLGFGGRGFGRHGGGPAGDITITKIEGSKLSLQTTDGWTRTIDATGATVTRAGQTVTLSALKVGDQIQFSQTQQTDGTFKITAIAVVLPKVSGTVTAVDSSSITIAQGDGSTKTIKVTSSTVYKLGSADATKSAVVVGIRLAATGTVASDGTFTAETVVVAPATAFGTVASKTASSITITARDGSSVTVKVTSSTTYQVTGVTNAALKDVAVGMYLAAQGSRNSDGSLTATAVKAATIDGSGWGPGRGMRGFGPGFPGLDFDMPGMDFNMRGFGPMWGPDQPSPTTAPSGTGTSG